MEEYEAESDTNAAQPGEQDSDDAEDSDEEHRYADQSLHLVCDSCPLSCCPRALKFIARHQLPLSVKLLLLSALRYSAHTLVSPSSGWQIQLASVNALWRCKTCTNVNFKPWLSMRWWFVYNYEGQLMAGSSSQGSTHLLQGSTRFVHYVSLQQHKKP